MPELEGPATADEDLAIDTLTLEATKTVKSQIGFLPVSIWNVGPNGGYWDKLIADEDDAINPRQQDAGAGGLQRIVVQHLKQSDGTRFSEFLVGIASRVLEMWSKPGDLVVDPFAGRATRAIVSWEKGRAYVGYEIVPGYRDFIQSRIDRRPPTLWDPSPDIPKPTIYLADGTLLDNTADASADLVFSCPPYFDTERYESVPGQLSDLSYGDFLAQIAVCAGNCYRVAKPGAYCAMVVSDFRRGGRLIPFHHDMMERFMLAGWVPHDLVISVMRTPAALMVGNTMKRRHTAKIHEYILAWVKPGG